MAQDPKGVHRIVDTQRAEKLLARWAGTWGEKDWHDLPGQAGLGCYGSGYGSWGVQTNQKYLGAMAALGALGGPEVDREWASARALAALRFSLWSHQSGPGTCTDGRKWGHGWISALGIERMMHGVALLDPVMSQADREGVRTMLTSEADWLLSHYPVVGGVWGSSKQNKPESNLWNGALMWRAAVMYPDHPSAQAWREKAVTFLVNSVSVESDATSREILDGKMVSERHVGANYFPNYALDHHGYLNVGYMVICLSNAAILHFDLAKAGLARPQALDHHQKDLWSVVRKMVFADGRLARIGGDTRVRYSYCQEYLLPSLMYAQEVLGETHACPLAQGMLNIMEGEAAYNCDGVHDGSFFGRRLAGLRAENPYYHTRLESDRASVLGFAMAHPVPGSPKTSQGFEQSAAGAWIEPAHGAALVRNPRRLASFAWRAYGLMQGMCQPGGDGHLADWETNMAGAVEVAHFNYARPKEAKRELLAGGVWGFEGGFGAIGAVAEGVGAQLMEGWNSPGPVRHALAYVALADGRTVVGIQLCRAPGYRVLIRRACGLGMALVNDLYNGFRRTLSHAGKTTVLEAPVVREEVIDLHSRTVDVEGKVGLVALNQGDSFSVLRSPGRQAGALKSLYIERIALQGFLQHRWFNPGEAILDTSWAAVSGASAQELAEFEGGAGFTQARPGDGAGEEVRVARVRGLDGRLHEVTARFGLDTLRLVYQIDGAPALDEAVGIGPQGSEVANQP